MQKLSWFYVVLMASLIWGVVLLHDKHLDKLMQLLPDIFMRVHRSYAVSLNEIETVSQKSGAKYFAHLKSGGTIPVGRTKFEALMAALQR